MKAILHIAGNCIGVLVAARLIPGITYEGGWAYLLLVGVVIGLINLLVKPLVTVLSIPFIVVTLGLFFLVINGAMLMLASALLDGLTVAGCGPAILGGLVLGIINWLVGAFVDD